MKNFIIFSVFVALSLASINAFYPINCTGSQNNETVYQGTPEFVAKVKNGEKYVVEYANRNITFLKLYGNAYEMGYAYGTLMIDELSDQITNLFHWMQTAIDPTDPALPKYLRNALANGTVSFQKYKFYVDLYYNLYTKNFTPQRFIDELKGISAATNISFSDLMGVNIVPELIKAQCSLIGAWGPATKYSEDGDLIQLRSLDFGHGTSPMSIYPQLTFYHSTEPGSYPFANVGWTGIIGSITAYSSYIGVSEASRDVLSNLTSRYGIPWTFALRDTIQFCKNLDEALIYLNSTTKTCSIYVGIGQSGRGVEDGQPDYRIVEYSNQEFTILSDKNMSVMNPDIDNVVGYLQEVENSNWCFLNSITPYYGNITEENIRQACAYDETGDSQVTIMNFRTQKIVLAYPTYEPLQMGYTQPAVQVDLTPFLQEMHEEEIIIES